MISYSTYKIIHLTGVLMLFLSLGGMLLNSSRPHPSKKLASATHGAGLFLILLGGFGVLARLGVTGMLPGWVIAKLAIWALLGAALWVISRKPGFSVLLWWGILATGAVAAALAITKPF